MKSLEEMNLTLAAFYGSKPDLLIQLVELLQSALRSELGPVFSAYEMDQVHATVIGLEGRRIGKDVFHPDVVRVTPASSPLNLHGLFQFMQEMHPLIIRMGGYAVSGGYPFTSRGQHPYIRSFALNGPLAVMIGWPVADESFPMTLDSLRRECRRFNVFHKYHRSEDDVDNDFYLVLGQIEHEAFPEEKLEFVQGHLRQLLSEQVPVDLVIGPEDLSVVCYVDTQLPIASSSQYSLAEALVRVEELKLCYREHYRQEIREAR